MFGGNPPVGRPITKHSCYTALNVGPEKAGSDPASKSPESKRKRKEEENLKYSHSCHFRTQSGNIHQSDEENERGEEVKDSLPFWPTNI